MNIQHTNILSPRPFELIACYSFAFNNSFLCHSTIYRCQKNGKTENLDKSRSGKMYPPQCNESCATKRLRLYIFYSVLFFTLVILALSHFIVYVVYRRRSKGEARDYMARKQEFFALSLTDLRLKKEARESTAEAEVDLTAFAKREDSIGDGSDTGSESQAEEQPEDSFSQRTSASSPISIRRMDVDGLLPGLQRIDEENLADSSRYSTSSSVSQRSSALRGALREPVVVTLATVSAIFAEEAVETHNGGNGEDLEERANSVMDISDIIDSPRSHVPQQQNRFNFSKSGDRDSTLSGHFVRGGSNHYKSTMSNHRDSSHHERSSEETE